MAFFVVDGITIGAITAVLLFLVYRLLPPYKVRFPSAAIVIMITALLILWYRTAMAPGGIALGRAPLQFIIIDAFFQGVTACGLGLALQWLFPRKNL